MARETHAATGQLRSVNPATLEELGTVPITPPEEVAKAIYYLCTDQSTYVTGAELHINGGQHV